MVILSAIMSQPSKKDTETTAENSSSTPPRRRFWKADQSMIATLALAVISLCALFVSIYQTRVLSLQQEVMAEQQRIMTESAKAQLWPNVDIGTVVSYNNDSLVTLSFQMSNTGTGPAIIENVSIQYLGRYIRTWEEMTKVDTLLPLEEHGRFSTSGITDRVIQAGEKFDFLVIERAPNLLAYLESILDRKGNLAITICYKSVFNEHWTLKTQLGSTVPSERMQVDACVLSDSLSFTQ